MKNLTKVLIFSLSTLVGLGLHGQPLPITHSIWTTNGNPTVGDDGTGTRYGPSASSTTNGVSVGDFASAQGNAVSIGSGSSAYNGAVAVGRLATSLTTVPNNNVMIGNFAALANLNTNVVNIGGALGLFSYPENSFLWNGLPLFTNVNGTIKLAPTVMGAGGSVSGAVTNLAKVQIFTNNLAYIPGIGYTNFTSSTSCGINEAVNLYPFLPPFTNNPFYSGLKIELGAGDFPFSSEINLGTNNISISGQSQWATILRYVGPTNKFHLIYEPQVNPSAGHLDIYDFSVVAPTNFMGTILDLTNDIMNMFRMQVVAPQNVNFGDSKWNYVVGNVQSNNALPGLVLMSLASAGAGGNMHSIKGCTFAGGAVGIYITDANWVNINDDCSFFYQGMYRVGLTQTFTNMYPIGDPRHCGAAIINNNNVGLVKVSNSHFLQCRAKIASTAGAPTEDFDNQNESCLLEDLCSGAAYMLYQNFQSAPPVSPSYGLDANFNTNGPCPIFMAGYYAANPSSSTTTAWNFSDGSNNVAYSFAVPDMVGGNDAGMLDYNGLTWTNSTFHFKNPFYGDGRFVTNIQPSSINKNVNPHIPSAVTLTGSVFTFSNATTSILECYFSGSTAYSVSKNGVAVFGTLAADGYMLLQPTNVVAVTYTVAPTFYTNAFQ